MSTGLNDIEQEETPEEKVSRLFGEGVKLTDSDIYAIYNGTYREQRTNTNSTNNTQNQNGNGNVTTLANSDSTNTNNTNNNVSGLNPAEPSPAPPPPPPPQPVLSTGTYTIWLKQEEQPYEDVGVPHKPKIYRLNKDETTDRVVAHTYKFCKCEGDPEDVATVRADARMGQIPRNFTDSARQKLHASYYVKWPKSPDASGNYAPEYEDPLWILNQNDEVAYIGDDQCPEGKKRLTADGVILGKIGSETEQPKKEETEESLSTVTYNKVYIEPVEYLDYQIEVEDGTKFPLAKKLIFPPVVIESITIPTGSDGTVVLEDLDLIREPYVTAAISVSGQNPKKTYDDIYIKPIQILSDKIKVRDNVPITFRSITYPGAYIDSINQPDPLPDGSQIEKIVLSEEPINLPSREYSELPKKEIEGVKGETTNNLDIINDTIILKNVQLKVPIKDRTTSLKFWNVMTNKPIINLDDTKNEELTYIVPNIMIPTNPKKNHSIDKLETTYLKINKNLIEYVEDVVQPAEVAKDKYIIYTMEGKTVPDVGDVYGDDDNGESIYYGVNEPFRDKTPVKNDFEYCKCSGDDAKTSENRGYARLGILLAGNTNQKYFKRDTRDRIAGTLGKYIGDDKCPDGETQVTNGIDPNNGAITLVPDKEEVIKIDDVKVDTKKIVSEDTTGEFSNLSSDIVKNLPEITIKELNIPIILEGGTTKTGTQEIKIDFSKLDQKTVQVKDNITVTKEPPKEEEQTKTPPKSSIPKTEKKGGGKKNNKKNKQKQSAKQKGKEKAKTEQTVNFDPSEEAIKLSKGRDIPKAPGTTRPAELSGKGLIRGAGGYSRNNHSPGIKKFAYWQWTWPIDYTYNPDKADKGSVIFSGKESRPSELGYWWKFFTDWNSSEPIINWNGGSINDFTQGNYTFFNSTVYGPGIAKWIMYDDQWAPYDYNEYAKKVGKMKLSKTFAGVGKEGEEVVKPIGWKWKWWRENARPHNYNINFEKKGEASRRLYAIAGKDLIKAYIPYGFNARWENLFKNFRLSKKLDPNGGNPKSKYGGPLPADYSPSLLDVGLIMNFSQCGYVNRYKLPNNEFPPLAASGTEQHLMMLDDINDKWIFGQRGEPMVGTFNAGKSIVINWAHEPHWCGISTDFFLRHGGFGHQGTTSVKSNEAMIIAKGLPLNRPRLEPNKTDAWDSGLWAAISGDGYGVMVRDKFKKAYSDHGPDYFEHPITPEYLNEYGDKINSVWFIGGIHYDENTKTMTQKGYELLKIVLNPDIIDWPAAIISHTGHVESVAAIDIDGDVFRLGGNTSTHGNFGNKNNTMGFFKTHISEFGGYPGGGERGGFALISKPDGISEKNRKHRVGGKGISSPWIITDVMRTYLDFLEMNPEPEYPVFNNYQTNINIINTIFNSNLR